MIESYQKSLFTKRWNKVRPLEPSELQIQISLVARLKLQASPGVVFFHVPNGEVRNKVTAAKLKAMGVLPGVADLLFFWKAEGLRALFLELKSRKGRQSQPQRLFQDRSEFIGIYYECTDNIDEAIAILTKYGILPAKQAA
jgi:hypothetical protein